MHPIAKGFRSLGAEEIRTKIVRGTFPYTVVTEARFTTIDVLGQRIIQAAGMAGYSALEHEAEGLTWTMSVRDPHAQNAVGPVDENMTSLLGGNDDLKIVRVGGQFVPSEGFDISDDGRVATVTDDKTAGQKFEEGAPIVKKLKWVGR